MWILTVLKRGKLQLCISPCYNLLAKKSLYQIHSCYRYCNEKLHLRKKNYKIGRGKFSWLKISFLFAGEQMYWWHGIRGYVWKNYIDWGEMLNPSVDWDSHYQMVFHEFHSTRVLGEWQVKNPAGCGCLPLLPRVLYLVRVVTEVPRWRAQRLSTVVQFLNEGLLLFALTVLGEVAGEWGGHQVLYWWLCACDAEDACAALPSMHAATRGWALLPFPLHDHLGKHRNLGAFLLWWELLCKGKWICWKQMTKCLADTVTFFQGMTENNK